VGRHPFSTQQTPENDPEQPGRIFYSAKTEGRQNPGIMSPGVYEMKLYCVCFFFFATDDTTGKK
jgi:hypothetical protein